MTIYVERNSLIKALTLAGKVAPSKSPRHALTCALMVADDSGVRLIASDLETTVSIGLEPSLPTEDAPGRFLIPIKPTLALLRESTLTDVGLMSRASSPTAYLACGLRLDGDRLDAGEIADRYPNPSPERVGPVVTLGADSLGRMVARTLFAADDQETRYTMGGLYLERADGTLSAVGASGRRLARQAEACEGPIDPSPLRNPIVPIRAAKAIATACRGSKGGSASLAFTADGGTAGIVAKLGDVQVYARGLAGRFPRYQDCFLAAYTTRIGLDDHTALLSILSAALPAARARDERHMTSRTGVDLIARGGALSVVVMDGDEPIYSAELPCRQDGPDIAQRMNAADLIDGLKTLGKDPVAVACDLLTANDAALWQTADGWDLLLMPLSVERPPPHWPTMPTDAEPTPASRRPAAPTKAPAKPKRVRKPRAPKVAVPAVATAEAPEPTEPPAEIFGDTLPSLETAGATHSADATAMPDGADAYAPYRITLHGCPTVVSETSTADDVFPADPETIDAPGEPLDAPSVTPAGWEAIEADGPAPAPCCGPAEAEPCRACATLAPPAGVFGTPEPARAASLHASLALTIADKRGERRYGLTVRAGSYLLESDRGDVYEVTETSGMVSCSCPDFQHRAWADREGCKHAKALRACNLLPPAPTVDPEPDPTPGEEWTMPTDRETILAEAFDRAEAPALVAVAVGSPEPVPEPTADEPPTPRGGFSDPPAPDSTND